jgi:hypothetical protein
MRCIDLIRSHCERLNRNPILGEVIREAGMATRIIDVDQEKGNHLGRAGIMSVTFTLDGPNDGARSCCTIRNREKEAK